MKHSLCIHTLEIATEMDLFVVEFLDEFKPIRLRRRTLGLQRFRGFIVSISCCSSVLLLKVEKARFLFVSGKQSLFVSFPAQLRWLRFRYLFREMFLGTTGHPHEKQTVPLHHHLDSIYATRLTLHLVENQN